jgi:PadR family transcriptional regulator, regulatory protein AphA
VGTTAEITQRTTALSSTEVAILGLLTFGEKSGYDLHRLVERSVGFFWRPARSQIYAVLPRLVDRGFARRRDVVQELRPDKQLYRITPAGRTALREWLKQSFEWGAPQDPFQLRLFFAGAGEPEDAVALIDGARERARAHVERLNAIEREGLSPPAEEDFFPHLSLKLGRKRTLAFVEWADEALREIRRKK